MFGSITRHREAHHASFKEKDRARAEVFDRNKKAPGQSGLRAQSDITISPILDPQSTVKQMLLSTIPEQISGRVNA